MPHVRLIISCGEDWHYDLTVPGYDNFVANGIVHHNCGKSIAGAYEAWAHLTGRHRWQPDVRASPGWAMVADLENTYPVVSEKLRQVAPLDLLDSATRYIEGKGWYTNGRRMIRTKRGHTMAFRSGEGSDMSSESGSVGWLWIDEPPVVGKFGGALSRVAVAEGPVWMTFTPINRPVAWLRLRTEGDPKRGILPSEEWVQFRPRLTEADCTLEGGRVIRSAASIARQVAGYSEWERMQRVYGEWEGISDKRRLSAFSEAIVRDDMGWIDGYPLHVGIGIDHGEAIGHQVAVLLLWQEVGGRRRVHVIDEIANEGRTTEADDARAVLAMLARNGLELRHVDRIVGDINSSGKAGAGRSVNGRLTEELNDQAGYPEVLVEVDNAKKGRIDNGVRDLDLAMMRAGLAIHSRCQRLIESCRYWDGTPATESYKHGLDALRYIAGPLVAHDVTSRGSASVEIVA
ncbi:hypothetical protein LBMAG42_56380 [Deltaproteobacteria bacterium]|nr:hypothetical protein LBMAG42_56380 [Deltaproteobacteria bacterium]